MWQSERAGGHESFRSGQFLPDQASNDLSGAALDVAYRIAAERTTPERAAELQRLVAEMDEALSASDGPRWAELNRSYHLAI